MYFSRRSAAKYGMKSQIGRDIGFQRSCNLVVFYDNIAYFCITCLQRDSAASNDSFHFVGHSEIYIVEMLTLIVVDCIISKIYMSGHFFSITYNHC